MSFVAISLIFPSYLKKIWWTLLLPLFYQFSFISTTYNVTDDISLKWTLDYPDHLNIHCLCALPIRMLSLSKFTFYRDLWRIDSIFRLFSILKEAQGFVLIDNSKPDQLQGINPQTSHINLLYKTRLKYLTQNKHADRRKWNEK